MHCGEYCGGPKPDLTNSEYVKLWTTAVKVIRYFGVVGEFSFSFSHF